MPAPAWESAALCQEIGPALFTIDANYGKQVRDAKAICHRCPVEPECLAAALAEEGNKVVHHRTGIRGGATARERWDIHKQQQAA